MVAGYEQNRMRDHGEAMIGIHAAIIHVAGADLDATYGAYIAAETYTSGDIARLAS